MIARVRGAGCAGALAGTLVALGALLSCTSSPRATPAPSTPPVRIHTATQSAPPGKENVTGAAQERCQIATVAAVTRTFGGGKVAETVGTTGIGAPTCRFVLTTSNLRVPGTVTVTLTAGVSRATFARGRPATRGTATVTGIGDHAFYVPNSGTLQLLKGTTRVVVQTDLRIPAGPPARPKQLRKDVVALGAAIAAGL